MKSSVYFIPCVVILLSSSPGSATEDSAWQRTNGPDEAYWVNPIVFHPSNDSILFIGTNRGLYKTTDDGQSWIELVDDIPADSAIEDVALDWENPNFVYARTRKTLYRSTDAGQSWARADLNPQGEGGYQLEDLDTDPNQPGVVYQIVVFGPLGKNEIWKSEDHGTSWSCIFSEGPSEELGYFFHDLIVSPHDPSTMWMRTIGRFDEGTGFVNFFVSRDGGLSWSSYGATDPLEGAAVTAMAVHPLDSLTVFLAGRSYPDLLYRTTDGGESWDLVLSEGTDYPVVGIYIDRNNPSLVYAAGFVGFLVSQDLGETWHYEDGSNLRGVNTDIGSLAVSPSDPDRVYLGGVGGVLKSIDGGMNFMRANDGLRSSKLRCIKANPYNPDEAYTLTFKGYGLYKTTDGGLTWFQSRWSRVSLCSMIIDVAQADPKIVYVTGGGAFRSTNGGLIWEWLNNQFSRSHAHGIAIDPFDERIVYVGIGADKTNPQGDGMYRSTDGGESWQNIVRGFPAPVHVAEVKIDPTNPRTVYIATRGQMLGYDFPEGPGEGIYKSTNMGEEWFPVNNGLTNLSVHTVLINPRNPNILYAATEATERFESSGGVFRSTDAGESWFPVNNGLPPNDPEHGFLLNIHAMVMDPSDPDVLYAGRLQTPSDTDNSPGNIYKTSDGGENWFRFDEGLTPPNSENVVGVEYLDIDPTGAVLYCGTFDSGVYRLGSLPETDTIPPVITAGPALFDFHPHSVTVRWNTHESGTSLLEYGISAGYGYSLESDSPARHHEFTLTDLDPDATYHLRVGSRDALGNGPRWSSDFAFTLSESDFEGPRFHSATDLQNATGTGPFTFDAELGDNYGVQDARLFWSTDHAATFDQVPMDKVGDLAYTAQITVPTGTEFVDYYYEAADAAGNITRLPDMAPLSTYAFSVTAHEMSPFLYVSLIDRGTLELNMKTGGARRAFEFSAGNWIPFAGDSLMVGILRQGIRIVETGSHQVIGELDYPNGSTDWPWSLCALLSPDEKYLYMEKAELTDTVAVIDLETLSVEKILTVGDPTRMITGLEISADGRLLYVATSNAHVPASSNRSDPLRHEEYIQNIGELRRPVCHTDRQEMENGYLHVIDIETGEIVHEISLGSEMGDLDFSRDHRYLYALSLHYNGHSYLFRIDPMTHGVVDSSDFTASGGLRTILVTRKSNACYVYGPQVLLLDLENLELTRTVPFDFERQVFDLFKTRDDNYLLFSDRVYGEVLVLDTRTNSFPYDFQFGGVPMAIAVVNKPWSQTGVEDSEEGLAPTVATLSQNYPNPANPSTTISFEVPQGQGDKIKVRLRVYNLKGQLVRRLLDEERSPGSYATVWDGKDDRGAKAASGIYLYELRMGDVRRVKKMMLIK